MVKNKIDTFKNHLGYDGKKFNSEKALALLNEIGVNSTNDIGETPLIIAAYLERIEILKYIIGQTQNIDFKVQGSITDTALLEACGQRRLESIKLLIEAGADIERKIDLVLLLFQKYLPTHSQTLFQVQHIWYPKELKLTKKFFKWECRGIKKDLQIF